MASTVFNGTDLLLKVSSTDGAEANIGHTTSCTISLSNDLPEATTKDSGGFQEVIAGVRSGEISFEGLLARTKLFFEFGTAATGDQLYSGAGFLSSLEVSAEMESPVTYSGSITITGTITAATN
jgi:hypothetical protein